MAKGKRSPLRNNPLRTPGQSVDEEINKILGDDVSSYIFVSFFCITIASLEWWRLYNEIPPSPIVWTVFAVVVTAFSIFKLIGYKKRIGCLKLGRDGEREVGHSLELLREKGYRVFHDLLGENFNLDHVVVCEHGIFVIETKTRSKPKKGESKIIFDGNEIRVNGFNTGKKILSQVIAQAKWLESEIKDSTAKSFFVKPVIVFPGWYIKSEKTHKKSNVWVLNPKALPTYIENSPKLLTKDDMALVSSHISQFIKASYEQKV